MQEIDLQSAIETNVLKLGTLTMEAHADRLIVVQDPFVSGYECTTCGGKNVRNEVSYVACSDCRGTGQRAISMSDSYKKCSTCDGTGQVPCPDCDGKGGVIIVPDASERRPTTGTIVSVGDQILCPQCEGWGRTESLGGKIECLRCKGTGGSRVFDRGQAVIYPSFVGHTYDLTAEDVNGNPVAVTIVIMRESEVLAKVAGHLELRRVKKSTSLGTAA
jgi:RecJ-like exonuclease